MTPVVALGTKARPSGSASRNAPSRFADLVEQLRQLAVQEPDRLPLQAVAPAALDLEDRCRAGAERAVVEERPGRVEADQPRSVRIRRWPGRCVSPSAATIGSVALGPEPAGLALADDEPRLAGSADHARPLGQPQRAQVPAAGPR